MKVTTILTDSFYQVRQQNAVAEISLEISHPSFATTSFQIIICPISVDLK